jgi:hypothetical protein
METVHETAGPPTGEGLTFEKVWAALMELRESQKETAEQMKETDRRMKETDKRVGELTNRFGDMVESMVVPNLVVKFQELGFAVTKAGPRLKFINQEHRISTEVDAYLEDGDTAIIVEIKTTPTTEDIKDQVKRMKKLRAIADLNGKPQKYRGAVAGVVFSDNIKFYALKTGFYVLEPSGETFTIITPEEKGYTPREW